MAGLTRFAGAVQFHRSLAELPVCSLSAALGNNHLASIQCASLAHAYMVPAGHALPLAAAVAPPLSTFLWRAIAAASSSTPLPAANRSLAKSVRRLVFAD